jgi:formylglycine-generating enzyme
MAPSRSLHASALLALAALAVGCGKLAGIDDLTIANCKGGICPEASVDAPYSRDAMSPRPDASSHPPHGDAARPPPRDAGREAAAARDTGDNTHGDASDSSTAHHDAETKPDASSHDSGAPNPCDALAPPTMVAVGPADNSFCIDSTEVTFGQYRTFVTAKGTDTSGQPIECAWNSSYVASLPGSDDQPAVGINWCDAVAYCSWAGKRLCGAQENGINMGPAYGANLTNAAVSQWFIACSDDGDEAYPYGQTYEPGICNIGLDAGKTFPADGSACIGGYPGVVNMIGNVWEFVDSCPHIDGGSYQNDPCLIIGGGYTSAATYGCVVSAGPAYRGTPSGPDLGFRCCSK